MTERLTDLQQVEDVCSIQAVVAEPVQQLHLSARVEAVEQPVPQRVGLPLLQLPPVADDVIQVAAERLGAEHNGGYVTVCPTTLQKYLS